MQEPIKAGLSRRQVLKRGAAGATTLLGGGVLAACGGGGSSSVPAKSTATASPASGTASGSITIGSFQDTAMEPFRDTFIKRFQTETGIKVKYNETSYDA